MRITGLPSVKEVRGLIDTAVDCGINFFDHADIYAGGEAERIFGQAVDAGLREKIFIQTKCAIRPGICYDFSKKHILESVDKSLARLNTDYIDILLLHRPDTLMEPEEVAEAFDILERAGKVRYFGVSNQNAMQIELLNHYCGKKILIDQLQFSIAHCDIIDSGINVNVHNDAGANRDGSVLEYCRLKDITIQAWSPFQYGMFEGVFLNSDKYPELNRLIGELAEKYQVDRQCHCSCLDPSSSRRDTDHCGQYQQGAYTGNLPGIRCASHQRRVVCFVYGCRKTASVSTDSPK